MEIHNLISLNQNSLEATAVENVKVPVTKWGVHQQTNRQEFFSWKIHLFLEQRNFDLVGVNAPLNPPPPPPDDTGKFFCIVSESQ